MSHFKLSVIGCQMRCRAVESGASAENRCAVGGGAVREANQLKGFDMGKSDPLPFPFLDEATIAGLLSMEDLIPTMAQASINYSAGRISQADRQMLPVPTGDVFFGAMPAAGDAVGVKLVNFFPGNTMHNLPTHLALIALFNPETGQPRALMDGRLITKMRTAAVTAAVMNRIAPTAPGVLTIMGTGLQAEAHIEALSCIRTFDEIIIWGRSEDKAKAFAQKVGARYLPAEEAVRRGDVVITVTAAKEPIFQGGWLKPGAVVASVGWNSCDGRELDDEAMQHTVLVESRSGTEKESGNIRGSGARIFAEAGEVLAGTKSIEAGAIVVFDSIGMAAEDVATAQLVFSKFEKSH